MAIYYPGCPESIPKPVCSDCPTKELGDVRSLFFVDKDFTFNDITLTAEWTTGINNSDIYVFPYTRGTLEVAETLEPGFGDQDETLAGYLYTLTVMEPNYKNNWAYWNSIKNSKRFKVGWRTETQVHLSDVTALIVPKAPIGEDKKAGIYWNLLIKFTQEDLPQPLDMPTGVFDQCIDI